MKDNPARDKNRKNLGGRDVTKELRGGEKEKEGIKRSEQIQEATWSLL